MKFSNISRQAAPKSLTLFYRHVRDDATAIKWHQEFTPWL